MHSNGSSGIKEADEASFKADSAVVRRLCRRPFLSATIVRNPWDRLISAFIDKVVIMKFSNRSLANKNFTQSMSFKQFIHTVTSADTRNNVHWEQMHTRCQPATQPFDVVLRLEDTRFVQSLKSLASALNWSSEVVPTTSVHSTVTGCNQNRFCRENYLLLLINQSASARRRNFYTPELAAQVGAHYRNDIVPYGYTF